MNYLDSLNTEQRKAVETTEGPVLIVAGAGAGKTKTLTHRILHLIVQGVKPENILAITFTNKAGKEMKERVIDLIKKNSVVLGTQRTQPFVSTFHSLGVQIIKENAEILKIPRHFSIYDKSDSKKAIKEAISILGLDPKEHLDKISHIISKEKSRGINIHEYLERGSYDQTSELVKKVWQKYEETLKKEGALDFDDLLLKTLKLLEKFPDVLEKYQNRYLYIHVDEYQDTNKVQNTIVEMLAKKHKNICVVGDTDQNIYSWRGAEIKNMLHFEKTYPEVQTFFLEQNYRSTKNILAVANTIIEKNNYRIPKKLFTLNNDGEKIGIFEARSEIDEAHFIALKSKELIEKGVDPEQIAVLYRANFQSRVLEEAFLAYAVQYQMLGTKFFERKEIKDCLSYIKASLNESSLSDLARIINIPARGIGKTTLQKILQGKESELPMSMQIKINNFRKMLLGFREVLLNELPSVAIKNIIKNSGMEDMYKTGLEEDLERLENIMELVTLATSYDIYPGEEGIEKFLTDSALASDQDSLDGKKNGVKLMTVHSSKGLEFDYVFVTGLEANLFPHNRMNQDKKSGEDAEEERRLFYVAITRAGKKLYLTHARVRTIFGTMEVNSPSEFLDDIPAKFTEDDGFNGVTETKAPLFSIDF
ncbi:MAG TPA: UvrD-helicase domain-containing protein [Parcubacteria group bacterium]|jgi:DNA helicase-2/ATP-dependent DNA helicase PcrA|nr:UvrD-helicase domain-containing protein [Parcubacteria group bacterium]